MLTYPAEVDLIFLSEFLSTCKTLCMRVGIFWPAPSLLDGAIQPRNYQVSNEVVHELEFGDIAVKQI